MRDLRPFLLKPGDSLREALARMARNGLGLALSVNHAGRLAGSITDADLRAAVMRGADLDASVLPLLNRRPAHVSAGANERQILRFLAARRLRAVPLTAAGRVAGVRSLDDFPQQNVLRPIAVIMAGGRGQRLRPLTNKMPKPLLRVGASTILERIIANLARAGIEEIYLSVNYKAHVFERRLGSGKHLGVHLRYLREKSPLGTAGALSLLPEQPRGPVLVTNADILSRLDYARVLDFHWRFGGAATIAAVDYAARIPYGVVRTAGVGLLDIEEKPEIRVRCSAGIYVFEPKALRFVPDDRPTHVPELLALLRRARQAVHVFPVVERWFDIGSPEDFHKVLLEFATGEEE